MYPKGKILTWALLVLVAASGLTLLFYLQKEPTPVAPITTGPRGFKKVELTEAQKKQQDESSMINALKSSSPEDCDEIEFDENLKIKCKDTVTFTQSLKTKSEADCDRITDSNLKESCLNQTRVAAAMETRSASLCDRISSPSQRQNCADQINALVGRTAQNVNECDIVKDPALRERCADTFFLAESVKRADVSGCSAIADETLKERCEDSAATQGRINEIARTVTVVAAKTNEQKTADCDALTPESKTTCLNSILFDRAFTEKNLSLCNSITDSTTRSRCTQEQGTRLNQYYLRQAMSQKNPTLCNSIVDSATRALCLRSVPTQ